ncbi:MAG: HAMP domain-containing sensor histidine kinase [Actinomycetota bacterium]
MSTIRRRLFRSHFAVMFVALGVLAAVSLIGYAIFEIVDGVGGGGGDHRGPGGSGGGFGDGDDFDGGGPLFLLIPLAAAILAASLVSVRVARRLATPIESMREATTRIAEGDYDVVVDGGDTAELAALAADVNTMAREIAETEARRLQLIGDIAHELRNPLATIEGSMEALMDGVIPATDETYAGVAREAARLRRLAGDLSALSAAGERVPGVERVDLVALVGDVVERLRPQAAAQELELAIDADGDAVVEGSPDQLTQVFVNVIGNAVQYTPSGSVRIAIRSGTHRVAVSVVDTGRGLASDDLERIFERFVRVDEDFADGTGVGLTIARSLTRAHGGDLTAASPGPGHGSTFTVDLPLATPG